MKSSKLNKWYKKILVPIGVLVLMTLMVKGAGAVDFETMPYAQYIANTEDRYLDYAEGFHDEFNGWNGSSSLFPKWRRNQYYYSKKHLFKRYGAINNNVLAHVAGHGSNHQYQASDGWCNLGDGQYAWGTKDITAFVAFQSCWITSLTDNWRQHWKALNSSEKYTKPFCGVHVVCGFKSKHQNTIANFLIGKRAGEWLADEFAENLKSYYSVRRAWYKAAEAARSHFWYMPSDRDKPSIFFIRSHKYEDIDDSTVLHPSYYYRYGSSNYLVDAYYME